MVLVIDNPSFRLPMSIDLARSRQSTLDDHVFDGVALNYSILCTECSIIRQLFHQNANFITLFCINRKVTFSFCLRGIKQSILGQISNFLL